MCLNEVCHACRYFSHDLLRAGRLCSALSCRGCLPVCGTGQMGPVEATASAFACEPAGARSPSSASRSMLPMGGTGASSGMALGAAADDGGAFRSAAGVRPVPASGALKPVLCCRSMGAARRAGWSANRDGGHWSAFAPRPDAAAEVGRSCRAWCSRCRSWLRGFLPVGVTACCGCFAPRPAVSRYGGTTRAAACLQVRAVFAPVPIARQDNEGTGSISPGSLVVSLAALLLSLAALVRRLYEALACCASLRCRRRRKPAPTSIRARLTTVPASGTGAETVITLSLPMPVASL